jgi:hypothetical protein
VHPTPKNQVVSLCPLKIPMHGISKSFQVNFHVLPLKKNLQNTSRFVTLFSAHEDVVVGFAIFHIVYSIKKKKEKNKRKRHSFMVCECWWAPDGIG